MGLLKEKLIAEIQLFGEKVAERCDEAMDYYRGERYETEYIVWAKEERHEIRRFYNRHHLEHWLKSHNYHRGDIKIHEEPRHVLFEWQWDMLETLTATDLMKLLRALQKVKK
jgi:hypothetical protein